jgi:serine/threonine-protein kinase HipA
MKELLAYVDGVPTGVFTRTAGGQIEFRYDESIASSATPLSMSMPLVRGARYTNRVASAFLRGLLPDNPDTLDGIARAHHTSAGNPFRLLVHVGRDTAGALQLLPPGEDTDGDANRTGDVEMFDDDAFEDLIADIVRDAGAWQRTRDDIRWSLAGAQPKVALFHDDASGRWGAPRDATPTTHILKPSGSNSRHDVNEFLSMRAARHLGLRVAEHEVLVTSRGHHVFVSRRYDRRVDGDGGVRRIHQEDMAQALGVDPSKKYQSDGGPGVAEIAGLFTRLRPRAQAQARHQFFEALVFTVASVNTDAHTKNYSMMHVGPESAFAPLYDLGSNVLYNGANVVESAMNIGGERRMNAIGQKQFLKAAKTIGVAVDDAEASISRILGGVAEAFATASKDLIADVDGRSYAADVVNGVHAMARAKGWS